MKWFRKRSHTYAKRFWFIGKQAKMKQSQRLHIPIKSLQYHIFRHFIEFGCCVRSYRNVHHFAFVLTSLAPDLSTLNAVFEKLSLRCVHHCRFILCWPMSRPSLAFLLGKRVVLFSTAINFCLARTIMEKEPYKRTRQLNHSQTYRTIFQSDKIH